MVKSSQIKYNPFRKYFENEKLPLGKPFGIIYYNKIQFIVYKQTIKELEFTSDISKLSVVVAETFQKFTELLALEMANCISEDDKVLKLQLTLSLTWLLGSAKFLQMQISFNNNYYEQ